MQPLDPLVHRTPGAETGRRCAATGLCIVPAAGGIAHRVVKDRGRGPLAGYPNTHVGPLPPGLAGADLRGRFDTIGSTVYFADTPETAFAEVLRGFRRDLLKLTPLAHIAGYDSAEEFAAAIIAEAAENGIDRPWAISSDWQMARSIYHVAMPLVGWWVRIDHPETLNALTRQMRGLHLGTRRGDLTSSDLESDDRDLTTLISEHIRGLTLDTGDEPLEISFRSKSLYGRCWAWWDRRGDAGLLATRDDPGLLSSDNVDTDAFRKVAADYGLPILPGQRSY